MKVRRFLIIFLVAVICITSIPQTVYAWKAKTHNYIANLILEEVQSNMLSSSSQVNIAPFGYFNVEPEFVKALTEYPDAFRAGAQGPDSYPDIYVGQTFIHPQEGKSSGEWLKMMMEDALKMPQNSSKRYEIISFLLGFMCHYAGDLFGHNYINGIAGGSYPDMTDLIDPDKAKEALNIITRHLASESYIDSKIPKQYLTGNKVNLKAPKDFILSTFVYNGHKNNGFSKHYTVDLYDTDYDPSSPDKFLPKHFQYIVELRNHLYLKSQYYRAYSNSKNALDYAENTVIVNYLDAWIADIDLAMDAWIQVSENIARGVVTSGDKNDLIVVRDELSNWFNKYGKYMTPVPDVIINSLGAPESFAKFLKENAGLDFLYDKYEEFKSQIEDMILNYMLYDVAGLSEEDVNAMREALSAPNLILGNNVLAVMDQEMKNFGTSTALTADQQEFAPFYNSLVMTKLILIGSDGVNKLIQQATGSYTYTNYQKSIGKNTIDNLKVRIKTKKNKTKWGIPTTNYGTDDDIYFGVILTNGTTQELLFDKSGKNDFNSNNDDTYAFALNVPITPSEIKEVYLRKAAIVNDDWNPEFIEISGYYGTMKVVNEVKITGLPEFKYNETWRKAVGFADSTYTTALNTGMIDFMESLDGSLQWQSDNFSLWKEQNLRTNVLYKIFKDIEKYEDKSYDMYAAYQSKSEGYQISLDANGGYVDQSNLLVSELGTNGKLPIPERKGYTFKGWYTKQSGGSLADISMLLKANSDITLYAQWTKVSVGKSSIKTLSNSSSLTISLKLNSTKGADGYQVIYATDSKFLKDKKTNYITATSTLFKKLTKGKTYYVKIRAYKLDSAGKKVFGSYSDIKKLKVTK